jgi:hypothetical protein
MVSKSRFNRRLHALQDLLLYLFRRLGETFKHLNADSVYLIDSFPVPVCDNIRIRHSKLYGEERYRGYTASKRRYFYGLKIFLLVIAQGEPVELFVTPGSVADVNALHIFDFDLPEGSTVYGDSAFTEYAVEDALQEAAGIHLKPLRKKNSQRAVPAYVAYLQARGRKMVETASSLLTRLWLGDCQDSFASGLGHVCEAAAFRRPSLGGLSQTSWSGSQSRAAPDQRSGCWARACA